MYPWFYVLLYSVIYVTALAQIFTVCSIRTFYNYIYRHYFYTERQLIDSPEGVLPPCQVCMIEVYRQVAAHMH